jgi:hypothetical protein
MMRGQAIAPQGIRGHPSLCCRRASAPATRSRFLVSPVSLPVQPVSRRPRDQRLRDLPPRRRSPPAGDAGLNAVARVRRAARAADGGVLSVPHGLDVAKGTANACATRWPDSPLIAPVTAYRHRSCVETYRRSIWNAAIRGDLTRRCPSARSCSTDWA